MIAGKRRSGPVVSLVDRVSQDTLLLRAGRTTAEVVDLSVIGLPGSGSAPTHIISPDNVRQFAGHAPTFAETRLNEHTHGLVREYSPKESGFRQVPGAEVQAILNRLNARPGKFPEL